VAYLRNLRCVQGYGIYIYDFLKFVGVKVGLANFVLRQSIGIDEDNTFQLKFSF